MKFSCERCGKRYATAENPAPGRVYKLKCKACGHIIVVKTPTAGARPAPPPPPVPSEPRAPASAELEGAAPGLVGPAPPDVQPPEIRLEIAAPEPEQRPSNGARAPAALDGTTEISMPSLTPPPFPPLPAELPPPPEPVPEPEPQPAPKASSSEAGYVDLFADTGSGAAPLQKPDDPFLAAARASLPDNYGSGTPGAPDPFAPLREELSEAARTPEHTPAPAVPKVPVIPKPPQQKSGLPIALIGAGVAVLIGILAFVLLGSGKKGPPPASPSSAHVAQAPAPPSPPLAPVAPESVVAAPAPPAGEGAAEAKPPAETKGGGDDPRRAREEKRRRDREEAKQREAQARAERERERREVERVAAVNVTDAEGGLTQGQIERVLQSTKKAFDGCIQGAQGSDVKLDGRRVMLRLNIENTGAVTNPILDDVTLNGTQVGSCLKSAARLMVFPKFKGDTMHVEVPLVMR